MCSVIRFPGWVVRIAKPGESRVSAQCELSRDAFNEAVALLETHYPQFTVRPFGSGAEYFVDSRQVLKSYALPHEGPGSFASQLAALRNSREDPDVFPKTVGYPAADIWAGKITWSRSFSEYGGIPTLIVELKPQVPILVDHYGFKDVDIVKDYYGYGWRAPLIGTNYGSQELALCQAFSAAGVQNPHDPRAYCFGGTASVLDWCGVDSATLEIITEFLVRDEIHGHCALAIRAMAARGMILRVIYQLLLTKLGDPVARHRSFFTFLNTAALSPPFPKTDSPESSSGVHS